MADKQVHMVVVIPENATSQDLLNLIERAFKRQCAIFDSLPLFPPKAIDYFEKDGSVWMEAR